MTITNTDAQLLDFVPTSASGGGGSGGSGDSGLLSGLYTEDLPYLIDPKKVAEIYNAPNNLGAGTKIGVIALGGGWMPSDLEASLDRIGITTVPTVNVISTDGTGNVLVDTGELYSGPGQTPTMPSFETALDVYCVAAVVPEAEISIYRGALNGRGFINALRYAVNDNCDAITISFTFDEATQTSPRFIEIVEGLLQQAVDQGTTVFVATGDWGSEATLQNKSVSVAYPSSSPNVVAVGGTYITLDQAGNFVSEVAASQSNGGVSVLFPLPYWQQNLKYRTYPDGREYPLTMRGVPDVVAPFGYYVLYFNGRLWAANGASASAPVMAGLAARYVSALGHRLGLITRDFLYPNPSVLNTILTAENARGSDPGDDATDLPTGYYITRGWNPLTGLGSIKGFDLWKLLDPPPYYATMKYGLGVTRVSDSYGAYKPLQGMWVKTDPTTWTPVQTGWVQRGDGKWERIYPTPRGIDTPSPTSFTFNPYRGHSDPDRDLDGDPTLPLPTLTITNTGDYDLQISNITITGNGSYFGWRLTDTVTNTALPRVGSANILLTPSESRSFEVGIRGLNVGTANANVEITDFIGYLGTTQTRVPVTVTVRPPYAGIFVPTPINLTYYEMETPATETLTMKNSGNGANLIIFSNSVSTNLSLGTLPTPLGYNYDLFTGNTDTFTVTAANLSRGTYNETITIVNNSKDHPTYVLPVTVDVLRPQGVATFENAGVYSWTVPDHVHTIDVFAIAGGAAGGPGIDNVLRGGGGGGGGSGGGQVFTSLTVTPGEVITVSVGDGGGHNVLGDSIYYPVGNGAWSSFMNSYAVWTHPDGQTPTGQTKESLRYFYAGAAGNYQLLYSADNKLDIFIDDVYIGTSNDFTSTTTTTVYLEQGNHKLRFLAYNQGGPAGFAVVIQDNASVEKWNTRTLLDPSVGDNGQNTVITGSFGTYTVTGGTGGGSAYNSGVYYYDSYYYGGGSQDGEPSPTGPPAPGDTGTAPGSDGSSTGTGGDGGSSSSGD